MLDKIADSLSVLADNATDIRTALYETLDDGLSGISDRLIESANGLTEIRSELQEVVHEFRELNKTISDKQEGGSR